MLRTSLKNEEFEPGAGMFRSLADENGLVYVLGMFPEYKSICFHSRLFFGASRLILWISE